jgi:hypothetical protein
MSKARGPGLACAHLSIARYACMHGSISVAILAQGILAQVAVNARILSSPCVTRPRVRCHGGRRQVTSCSPWSFHAPAAGGFTLHDIEDGECFLAAGMPATSCPGDTSLMHDERIGYRLHDKYFNNLLARSTVPRRDWCGRAAHGQDLREASRGDFREALREA